MYISNTNTLYKCFSELQENIEFKLCYQSCLPFFLANVITLYINIALIGIILLAWFISCVMMVLPIMALAVFVLYILWTQPFLYCCITIILLPLIGFLVCLWVDFIIDKVLDKIGLDVL